MTDKPPTANARPHVLLAEDDDELRKLIARALKKDSYDVTEVADGAALVSHLHDTIDHRKDKDAERFALIISDIRMPGVFGLSVVEGLQKIDGVPPVILITAFGDDETHARAKELGVFAIIDKPFKMSDLMTHVRNVVPQPA